MIDRADVINWRQWRSWCDQRQISGDERKAPLAAVCLIRSKHRLMTSKQRRIAHHIRRRLDWERPQHEFLSTPSSFTHCCHGSLWIPCFRLPIHPPALSAVRRSIYSPPSASLGLTLHVVLMLNRRPTHAGNARSSVIDNYPVPLELLTPAIWTISHY